MISRRIIKKAFKYLKHPFALRRYHIIEELAKNNKFTSFAEIGVWDGVTTRHILRKCEVNRVVCVDNYVDNNGYYPNERVKKAFENSKDLRHDKRVQFIQDTSVNAAKKVPDNSLDLIFIDAEHTYKALREDYLHGIQN